MTPGPAHLYVYQSRALHDIFCPEAMRINKLTYMEKHEMRGKEH